MMVEELLGANHYLDYITAMKLNAWINKVIIPPDSDGLYEEMIITTLKRKEVTYKPSKGNLLAYLKTSIRLDLLSYDNAPFTDYHSVIYEQSLDEPDVVMDVFTDQEILSMYNVSIGKASKEDIKIVKGLVDE